jgi:hypothetical protein
MRGNLSYLLLITSLYISFFLLSIFSGRKGLEQRTYQDDERIAILEQQLGEAQLIAEDSDRKYDEVIRLNELNECFEKLEKRKQI